MTRWANAPGSPISSDSSKTKFDLSISSRLLVNNAYCMSCGGQSDGELIGTFIKFPRTCSCQAVERWIAEGESNLFSDKNGSFVFKTKYIPEELRNVILKNSKASRMKPGEFIDGRPMMTEMLKDLNIEPLNPNGPLELRLEIWFCPACGGRMHDGNQSDR